MDHDPSVLRDGAGTAIDGCDATGTNGYGLLGLRERAKLVHGMFRACPLPTDFEFGYGFEELIRVLVVYDQTVARQGLIVLLGLSPGIEIGVVGAAAAGARKLSGWRVSTAPMW